jgi:hypothetical protein
MTKDAPHLAVGAVSRMLDGSGSAGDVADVGTKLTFNILKIES